MRDDNGETFYMIVNSCDPVTGEQVVGGVSCEYLFIFYVIVYDFFS